MTRGKNGIARVAVVVGAVVAGLLGVANPAAAVPAPTEFTSYCGFIKIEPSNDAAMTVVRNDEQTVGVWNPAATVLIGANVGDEFAVSYAEIGGEETYAYDPPEGCTPPASMKFTVQEDCQGLITVFATNGGSEDAKGFVFWSGEPDEFGDIPPGDSDYLFGVYPGKYAITSEIGEDEVTWLQGDYAEPGDCSPRALHAAFTDACGKITIDVTSDSKHYGFYFILKNDIIEDLGFVSNGDPQKHELPAAVGDEFAVYYPIPEEQPVPEFRKGEKVGGDNGIIVDESLYLVGSHVHAEADCDLAETGNKAGLIAGAGGALLVLGVGAFLIGRRRRISATPAA